MRENPVIKVEMEHIKASIMHHMRLHNDEFNEMVQRSLANTLNEDWVKHSIQAAVDRTVQQAIDSIGDNWKLKNVITDALAEALSRMVSDNKTT